jgi:hypothetical protein
MAGFGKYRLRDVWLKLKGGGKKGGKAVPPHELVAEQTREAQERQAARNNEASIRDRMVAIGRAALQAGRHGQ